MPYKIVKSGSKYKVINTEKGTTKGTHSTKAKALSQMRLLQGIEHGWRPTFSKKAMASKIGSKK
jgi:hypothetical protein